MDSNNRLPKSPVQPADALKSNTTEEQVNKEQTEYDKAATEQLRSHTLDNRVSTGLKVALAAFIVFLIWRWFDFMRDVIVDYISHLHTKGETVPKEVIISIVTMGTIITGLMTHILKGLFGQTSENSKKSR